jgi:hypothetical protein
MPANEFEKKLQQRMEELKLAPSDEVWKEVEHRIRKEKKKRRAFFWLPLLFLILGGGLAATILLTNNRGNHIVQTTKEINKFQPNHSSAQKQPGIETSISKDNIEKIIIKENRPKEIAITKNANNQVKKSFIPEERFSQKNKGQVKKERKELIEPEEKEIINTHVVVKNNPHKQNIKPAIKGNTNVDQQFNQQKDTIVSKEIVTEKKNYTQEIQNQPDQSIKDSTANTAAEQKESIRLSKKFKKWQWGLMLEKGRSHTADGLKFESSQSFAGNLAASPGSGTYTMPAPSAIHPSGSFAAGIFVKRFLSSRFDVNLGLNYLYLSTKMNVGSKVDSSLTISNSFSSSVSLDNYYRASNSNSSYNNRYHFLSVSAELSWKIIDSKKINIYWNNGFSLDRLLSSNALYFDRYLPGYYKDYGLLTHNHLFLFTGFSVPVLKRFEINPFAGYSLTPVLRNAGSTRTHFANYGIRLKILVKNKK